MNIGNTCFMNAGLQLLFSCKEFREYINNNNGTLINLIKDIMNSINNPTNFKREFSSNHPMFKGSNQHDSHEFLVYLLDDLIEEVSTDIFKLVYKQTYTDTVYLNDNIIQLPIVADTLLKNIYNFFSQENIEGKTKILKLNKCPKCLVISFKRFGNDGRKISRDIYSPEKFNLHKYTYKLRSFVLHMGTANGGHYVAYFRNKHDWFLCNDASITKCNNIQTQLPKAYILLYERYDKN